MRVMLIFSNTFSNAPLLHACVHPNLTYLLLFPLAALCLSRHVAHLTTLLSGTDHIVLIRVITDFYFDSALCSASVDCAPIVIVSCPPTLLPSMFRCLLFSLSCTWVCQYNDPMRNCFFVCWCSFFFFIGVVTGFF